MQSADIFALGLGLVDPWKLLSQKFDMETNPHQLHLEIGADRGALYPCPHCGKMCKAHDFEKRTWRHLNFFQHHCYLSADVPRVKCPEHGIHRIEVPWARTGSGFTLLFEQVILSLSREMPVATIAREVCETDKRLWRIIEYYVEKALIQMDMSNVCGIGVDETARSRGHHYVTTFIDMDRETRPVLFCTEGKGTETIKDFSLFLSKHGGRPINVTEIVSDMSPSFLSGAREYFPMASVTVDWFHVVKHFNDALDKVRRLEARKEEMPKSLRWALLKGDRSLTKKQQSALDQLFEMGLKTSVAYLIKEKLRWVRQADSKSAARWRITNFLSFARDRIAGESLLAPIGEALDMFERHLEEVVQHWTSLLSNARMEGLNGLFQAARYRARGYRKASTFITMVYLIGAPIADILWG